MADDTAAKRAIANAVRRRQRILDDPDLGPLYVRLNRKDQITVDGLIEANQGKLARAKLVELDQARLERNRERRRITQRRRDADAIAKRWVLLSQGHRTLKNVNPDTVRANVMRMTADEVREAYDLEFGGVQRKAAQPIPPPDGNHFWYH